jgi:L-ribulose-5-phosphate 3-epimerase
MTNQLRIGVRAHDFGKLPPDELASRIAAKGFTAVQLALNKAIEGLDLQPGDLNPGLAFTVGEAFRRHGVQIAVLGCYINPLYPDREKRRQLIGWFKEHLRFARDFGCGLVALETGTPHPDYLPHPDTHTEASFRESFETLAELVAEAEKFGVIVGIEGVSFHAVSTPAKMRRMLDELASPNVQVVFDPVNLLSFENHREQQRVVEESLRLFGDRIVAVHAKDFLVGEENLITVPPGKGGFEYGPLLRHLVTRKPGISILCEETGPEVADDAIRHLTHALGGE